VVVLGVFTPQPFASICALVIVATQVWLMLSGNFSWLNLLTVVVASSAVNGTLLHDVVPLKTPLQAGAPIWFSASVVALTTLVVALSYWPVRNMFSGRQRMNAIFNPLHLVNTYGAFGHVTRVRHEVVLEGTADSRPGPHTQWQEYEFKGKPGDPARRPRQVAPYHLRLDWLMWFAGISRSYSQQWLGPLMVKLLQNDEPTVKLLHSSPFTESPPAFVRARLYRYRFTTPKEHRETRCWWVREPVGEFLRMGAEDVSLGSRRNR